MRKVKLRRIGAVKRVLNSSVVTHLARALRVINSEAFWESDSQDYSERLTRPYIPYVRYDEQKSARLQLLELERQKNEAVDLARRRTCA